jgi:hypothetical protein
VRNFRTAVLPPVLSTPASGYVSLEPRPAFDWEDVVMSGVTGYTIQFSTSNGFTTIAHTGSPSLSSYVPTVNLPLNTTVYWRVQTRAVNGPSAWSETRTLTTPTTPLGTPTLLLPANNGLTTDYTPTFSWSAVTGAGIEYILQVDDNSNFSSPEVHETALPAASHTPVGDLALNTVYYWRVRARNSGNVLGNWSSTFTLKTAVLPPVLSTPADDVTLYTLRPTFDWEDVVMPGVTGYKIQFSTSSTFASVAHTGSPMGSTYTPSVDLPKGMLYWRVQTLGGNGPSAVSIDCVMYSSAASNTER